jgi:hypothetical protein
MATLNARLQEKLTQSLANTLHFQDNNCNSETISSSMRFLEKAYGNKFCIANEKSRNVESLLEGKNRVVINGMD